MKQFGEQSEEGIGDWAYDFAGGGERGEIAEILAKDVVSIARDASKIPLGGWGIPFAALDGASRTTYDALKKGEKPSKAFGLATTAGASEAVSASIKKSFDILVEAPQNEFAINGGEKYNQYVKEALEAGASGAGAELFALAKIYGPEVAKSIILGKIENRKG